MIIELRASRRLRVGQRTLSPGEEADIDVTPHQLKVLASSGHEVSAPPGALKRDLSEIVQALGLEVPEDATKQDLKDALDGI